jgi:hypothetical protein
MDSAETHLWFDDFYLYPAMKAMTNSFHDFVDILGVKTLKE